MASTSQMMTGGGTAAMELLGHLFRGPQDLTYGDGASELAHRVFVGVGGHPANLYSFTWLRPLRPMQTVRTYLDRAGGSLKTRRTAFFSRRGSRSNTCSPSCRLRFSRLWTRRYSPRLVGADELLECIHKIGWRDRLKPVYERESFRWLISQVSRGPGYFQMATLSRNDGSVVGWYVAYFEKRSRAFSLFQIGVRRSDMFESALSAVFRDAWHQGAAAVKGQAIPQHLSESDESVLPFPARLHTRARFFTSPVTSVSRDARHDLSRSSRTFPAGWRIVDALRPTGNGAGRQLH